MKKADLQSLRSSVTPGATGELYKILGRPTFYDKTWSASNTLRLIPSGDEGSNMPYMRSEKLIFVKGISDVPIDGP